MIYRVLKKLISEIFEVDPSELHMDTSFFTDLSADSLDMYELILACEEEFDLEFGDNAASLDIDTIGDAVRYLENVTGDGSEV